MARAGVSSWISPPATFEAYWGRDGTFRRTMSLTNVRRSVGVDPAAFRGALPATTSKSATAREHRRTIARGGFGSPTIYLGDDMYFGNDRMPLIRAALERARAADFTRRRLDRRAGRSVDFSIRSISGLQEPQPVPAPVFSPIARMSQPPAIAAAIIGADIVAGADFAPASACARRPPGQQRIWRGGARREAFANPFTREDRAAQARCRARRESRRPSRRRSGRRRRACRS